VESSWRILPHDHSLEIFLQRLGCGIFLLEAGITVKEDVHFSRPDASALGWKALIPDD